MNNYDGVANWIVLIVDDEPDNVGVAQFVLMHYGAQVHTARNGHEGLEMLARINATLILLDLSMPAMSGWEMLTQLRANETTQHLPVIALTAHAMSGDKDRALEAGFSHYITKPFRVDTLMGDIQGCLARLEA